MTQQLSEIAVAAMALAGLATVLVFAVVQTLGARAQAGRVVRIIVEERLHVRLEFGIVRDLHDHVVHDLDVTVIMPEGDGVNGIRVAQIDLHPLRDIGFGFNTAVIAIGWTRLGRIYDGN